MFQIQGKFQKWKKESKKGKNKQTSKAKITENMEREKIKIK